MAVGNWSADSRWVSLEGVLKVDEMNSQEGQLLEVNRQITKNRQAIYCLRVISGSLMPTTEKLSSQGLKQIKAF